VRGGEGGGAEGGRPAMLREGSMAREVFGAAKTLGQGTAEPLLDEDFYRCVCACGWG